MIADNLRPGETFVCHSEAEWAEMSVAERKRAKRATLEYRITGGCSDYSRIHLRTSAGKWCIPKVAPVVKLDAEQAKNNPAALAKRAPRKAA